MPSPHREIHDWHSDPQKTSREPKRAKMPQQPILYTHSDSFVFMKRRRILRNRFQNNKSRFRVLGRGNAWGLMLYTNGERKNESGCSQCSVIFTLLFIARLAVLLTSLPQRQSFQTGFYRVAARFGIGTEVNAQFVYFACIDLPQLGGIKLRHASV
jgi:hypothetical protein